MGRLIDADALLNELWKSLFKYEDETEKKFLESDELDIGDWIQHRIFVQNMSDIDRQTLLKQPTVDAVEVVRCKDCKHRRHDGYCTILLKNVSGVASQWFVPADGWYCADGVRKEDADT